MIWVRSSFELRHLLILLLFVSKSNLLSVGILRSWGLVRISLFVFVDKCSMCLVFLVRVLDSWLIFFWGREQIWRRYSIAGERIVLNNLDKCIGSFLNLIRWVNWFILLVMILIVGLDEPFPFRKIPKYLIVSFSLRDRICWFLKSTKWLGVVLVCEFLDLDIWRRSDLSEFTWILFS